MLAPQRQTRESRVPPASLNHHDQPSQVDDLLLGSGGTFLQDHSGAYWTQLLLAWAFGNWLFLSCGLIVGLLLGAGMALAQPRRYVAESLVAAARTRTQVQFESTIKTVSDSAADKFGSGGLSPAPPERLQSLTELVNN